jgi:hypothetical protein
MAKRSRRWATLETATAEALGGERVTEPWFLFNERPDVVADLPDGGRLVCDCKAYQKFSHHTLLEAVQSKYCQPGDMPALVTKAHGQVGAFVTVPLDLLAALLKRAGGQT